MTVRIYPSNRGTATLWEGLTTSGATSKRTMGGYHTLAEEYQVHWDEHTITLTHEHKPERIIINRDAIDAIVDDGSTREGATT